MAAQLLWCVRVMVEIGVDCLYSYTFGNGELDC